jgi:molybdopterin/thiamine biosynthesis adenylyltransferase
MDAHKAAIQDLTNWLITSLPDAKILPRRVLSQYSGNAFVFGFHIPHEVTAHLRDFYVCIDINYPYSLPKVYLRDEALYLKIPHIEDNGYVCVNDERATGDYCSPIDVLKNVITAASQVLREGVSENNASDFLSEIHTYWTNKYFYTIGIIEELEGASRLLVAKNTRTAIYAADEKAKLEQWCAKALSPNQNHFAKTAPVVFVQLQSDPLPKDYPNTGQELLSFVKTHANVFVKSVLELCEESPARITFVFRLHGTKKPAYIAATVEKPRNAGWPIGANNRGNRSMNGFRPGKIPTKLLERQYFGMNKVARNAPVRLDASWVHGRDMAENLNELNNKHAVIIGCGSVGSEVAAVMAKSGVGSLTLIDNDHLKPENFGRHYLGNEFFHQNKAKAMKSALEKAYPHILNVNVVEGKWPHHYKSNLDKMDSIDLIISATADTATEFALNRWHLNSGRSVPIIYGWTELYATAGNALVIGETGPCFACSHDLHGENLSPVTEFDNSSEHIVSQPACGSTFQPYGPVQLGFINNMIANEAIKTLSEDDVTSYRRAWAADKTFLETSKGKWGVGWAALGKHFDAGERMAIIPCEPPKICAVCGYRP